MREKTIAGDLRSYGQQVHAITHNIAAGDRLSSRGHAKYDIRFLRQSPQQSLERGQQKHEQRAIVLRSKFFELVIKGGVDGCRFRSTMKCLKRWPRFVSGKNQRL